MTLDQILGKMNDFKEAREQAIDATFENIKNQSGKGNKNAQTILNYGNEKEIKSMINKTLNA